MENFKRLIFVLFLNNIIYAQTTFQKAYGGLASDNGTYVVQTSDNGYIVAGTTISFGEGGRDVYVLKTNANGEIQWTKTFGGATDNEYGFCVQQTSDGGYIISGVASSFSDVAGDMYLIKINASGDFTWSKTYGGIGYEWGSAIKQTTDGGYIVTGQTPAFGAGGFDAYLIKLDASGVIEWTKTYGGSGLEVASDVQQTTDGGYIIIGQIDSFGAGSGDIFLLKTDAIGNAIWSKAIGSEDNEEALEVKQTPDGGYIIAGSGYGPASLSRDMFLIKTNSLGVVNWAKTYGSNVNDQCESAILTNDGGYILCGYSFGFTTNANYQAYIVKTDSSGNTLWSKTYGGSSIYGDYGRCIQQTNDSGYIITGETYSFGIGFFNLYLIKTDILGNSGCNQQNANTITTNKIFQSINTPIITASGGLASSPDTIVNTGGTQTNICATLATSNLFYPNNYNLVYPNPFTDIITINLKEFNTVTIATIMDISGKQLLVCEVNSKKNTIDLSVLKSGIYFCQLKSINKTETVKIIKQ